MTQVAADQAKVTKNPVRARVVDVSKDGKTARVEIPTVVPHARYGKRLHRITTLHVDTAHKSVKAGSQVCILPCRRIAKSKSWKIVEVVSA